MVSIGIVLIYINAQLVSHFSSLSWNIPTIVYARPFEVSIGKQVRRNELAYELQLLGYSSDKNGTRRGTFAVIEDGFTITTRGQEFSDGIEVPKTIQIEFQGDRISRLKDSSGATLSNFRLESTVLGKFSSVFTDRELISLKDVPKQFIEILLVVEDKDFIKHHGVSFTGMIRAAIQNLIDFRIVAGGSTITQQLVKNLYFSHERTFSRKILEIVYAIMLDARFSKEVILETYLNEIFFGQWGKRAVHGIATASKFYFGKPLSELDLSEQALLVGLIKGPSAYDPRRYPAGALSRRQSVLGKVYSEAIISKKAYEKAISSKLHISPLPADRIGPFPAYFDLVKREFDKRYSFEKPKQNKLLIYTALDPLIQRRASLAVKNILDKFEKKTGTKKLEAGVVVIDISNGEIVAIVGGRENRGGFNRATDAFRQIGSLAKPFVVLSAFSRNSNLNLGSLVRDSDVYIKLGDGSKWSPKNSKITHDRLLSIERILAESLNRATVNLALSVGIDRIINDLEGYGLSIPKDNPPSTLLGVSEMSPLGIAACYQALFNSGFRMPLTSIRTVMIGSDIVTSNTTYRSAKNLPENHSVAVDHGLRTAVRNGTGRAFGEALKGFDVAGKTGTTDDGRDAWFVGADGKYLALAWVGRDDNKATNITGSNIAVPIVLEILKGSIVRDRTLELPTGMAYAWINRAGSLSKKNCPSVRKLPIPIEHASGLVDDCNLDTSDSEEKTWWKNWFGSS